MKLGKYHHVTSFVVSAIVVAMTPSSVSAYNVYIDVPNTKTCDGGRVVTKDVIGICDITDHNTTDTDDGEEGCSAGDTIQVTGNLSIRSPGFDADDNPAAYLTPCLYLNIPLGMGFSFKCFEEHKQMAGYLCDWYNYEKRGAACGQEGNYQMDFSITVPTEVDDIKFDTWGLPIDVMVKVNLSGACAADLGDNTVTYSAVGILLLSAAAGVVFRRRRRIGTTSDQDQADQCKDFVEMTDATEPGV